MNRARQPGRGDIVEYVGELRRRPCRLVAAHAEPDHQGMRVGDDLARHLHRPLDADMADTGDDKAALDVVIGARVFYSRDSPLEMVAIGHAGRHRVVRR